MFHHTLFATLLAASITLSYGSSCCSTHDFTEASETSTDGMGCDGKLKPLSAWNLLDGDADAIHNWKSKDGKGTWLSFAGDSELRYEFWHLVRRIGGDDYTVSDNFARVAFNISSDSAKQVSHTDQDPVTVEAKYMDYRFCCQVPGNSKTCHIQTGGDNVTKLHASFRKVDYWVSSFTDFTNLGEAASDFLDSNPGGLCITWKMVAYPSKEVVVPLFESQLRAATPPTAMILNPGLHDLCFEGNQRGSPGHITHITGFDLMREEMKKYPDIRTQMIIHNVLWANEKGLYAAYAKRGKKEKAATFSGLEAAISLWNQDALEELNKKPHPFELMDVNYVSNLLKGEIRKDFVHYEAPMYIAALTYDLNAVFTDTTICSEF